MGRYEVFVTPTRCDCCGELFKGNGYVFDKYGDNSIFCNRCETEINNSDEDWSDE